MIIQKTKHQLQRAFYPNHTVLRYPHKRPR